MSWVAVGLGGAGLLQGLGNEKKEGRHNQYRAEAIRYSPWTGMGDPGALNLPGGLEMALKGAGAGAMIGGMMGGEKDLAGADWSKAKTVSDAPQAMQGMGKWSQLAEDPYFSKNIQVIS